ncbi:unnamed protein product [Knipowitschia caucasica]
MVCGQVTTALESHGFAMGKPSRVQN